MSGGMGDPANAAKLRDVIKQIVGGEIDKKRPEVRIGTVWSFDQTQQTALVLFPGNDKDSLVPVRFALDKIPSQGLLATFDDVGYNGTGDVVRVAGKPGQYFIMDYVSGQPQSDYTQQVESLVTGTPSKPPYFTGAASQYYLSGRTPSSGASLIWDLDREAGDVDGVGIDPAEIFEYEVQDSVDGGEFVTRIFVGSGNQSCYLYPYTPYSERYFRVRSLRGASRTPSEWSEVQYMEMEGDGTSPAVPSTPTGYSDKGSVTFTWNGLDASGSGQVEDFDYVELHISGSPFSVTPGNASTLVAQLGSAGKFVVTNYSVGSTVYARLVARDLSSNYSGQSAQASVVVAAVGTSTTAPSVSPTPVVTPGPAAAIVRFDPPADPYTQIDLYVATNNLSLPSGATLHTKNVKAPAYVYRMPSSSGTIPTESDVYFALVARNGTASASPSAWVPGRATLVPDDYMTILAGAVIAQRLTGETVEGTYIKGGTIDITGIFHAESGYASLTGYLEALAATFRDNIQIRGLNNYLSGTITLATNVTTPAAPPDVSVTWEYTQLESFFLGNQSYGLCDNVAGNRWLTTILNSNDGGFNVVGWTKSGSIDFGQNVPNYGGNIVDLGGIVKIGSLYYVLIKWDTGVWAFLILDSTFAPSGVNYIRVIPQADFKPTLRPGFGSDESGNLTLAWTDAAGVARARKISTSGAWVGSAVTLALSTTRYNIGGVFWGKGPLGSGSPDYIWVAAQNGAWLAYLASDGSRNATYDYARPNGNEVRGIIYHTDGRFWSFAHVGRIFRHSSFAGGTYTFAYAWRDSDPAIDTSGYTSLATSLPSPRTASLSIPRGGRPTITTPAPPDDGTADAANTVIVYNAVGSGTLFGTEYTEGERTRAFDSLPTSGNQPVTTSGFASRTNTAGKLAASGQGFTVDGNSNGSIGTGTLRDDVRNQFKPYARRTFTTATTPLNNTETVVIWNNPVDLDGITYNTSTGVFTIVTPGKYDIKAAIAWANNSAGFRSTRILHQRGGSTVTNTIVNISGGTGIMGALVADTIRCIAGDTIQIIMIQTSGNPLAISATSTTNYVVLNYTGP